MRFIQEKINIKKLVIIQKSASNKCWMGVEKREPSYTVGGMQTITSIMENSVEIP